MAISRSLSIGTSSLRAHQLKFDVISNNLANLNTIGFKGNRANFEEQFSQVVNQGRAPESIEGTGAGGTNPIQFGLGVRLGSIKQDMSQGTIEDTNRPLDMAIQGEGFFMYNLNGQSLYSRAGNINRDKFGFLVDSSTGAILQGFPVQTDANGIIQKSDGVNSLLGTIGNIRISNNIISPPNQTHLIKMSGNLNVNNENGAEKITTMTIYDNVGAAHELKLKFILEKGDATVDPPIPDSYLVEGELNGETIIMNNGENPPTTITSINFGNDGTLNPIVAATANDPAKYNLSFEIPASLATRFSSSPTIQLTDPNQITTGITNYAAANSATITEQDGYQTGGLIDLSVDNRGQIWGSFTNGKSERLGQVAVAKFTNNEGLVRNGANFYRESPNSGNPNVGTAVDIFPSTQIAGGSLEQSNVDMTVQFTDMISTQRAYEAAARTVTISDQLLQETTNLKR
ncbi:MAG: flagellar hook-basal body complex protein [Candidatus Kapaibacterium sp.]